MKTKLFTLIMLSLSFLVLTFIYVYSRSNLTVINYSLSDSILKDKASGELTKGEKINGEFSPKENYLGQVLIRFYNYQRINTDEVEFRIKEKSQNGWFYEHTYKTDQFLPDNLFTFGFPTIADSKGKTYDFEIESVNGTPEESVTLSKFSPLAALSFQYPKTLLIKNPKLAISFLVDKLRYTEINRDSIFSFLIYLNFILVFVLLEYVFIKKAVDYKFKNFLNGQNIIVLGLSVMLVSMVVLYLKKPVTSLYLTSASYFLFVIGTIWILIEQKMKKH